MHNRRGATLWFILACALFIVLLGVGLFYLLRILSGSATVGSAVDSGTLNVAKHAIVQPTVNVSDAKLTQFLGLGEKGSDEINIGTYNRAVALALLAAINAKEEGTPEAEANAKKVVAELQKLEKALREKLENDPNMINAFNATATPNVPKTFGGDSHVEGTGSTEFGYYQPGGPTNVFFNPLQLPPQYDTKDLTTGEATAPGGEKWIAGYKALSVGKATVIGTPVFPNEAPHLISTKNFGSADSVAPPGSSVLPNSFRKYGGATAHHVGKEVQAAASSVVGSLNMLFPASFPRGYVRIVNPPGINEKYQGSVETDGTNDLFNKELFAPSHITQATNGVFTTDAAQFAAWCRYNRSEGDDQFGHDGSLFPEALGFKLEEMRYGRPLKNRATIQQLLGVKEMLCDCRHTDYDVSSDTPCEDEDKVSTWAGNYGRSSIKLQFKATRGFLAVEWLKAACLEGRGGVGKYFGLVVPAPPPTGLMKFKHGGVYPYPMGPLQFAVAGTPWELMQQVGDQATKAPNGAFDRLLRRCRQIKPECTREEVIAALNSKTLPVGTTLFLYADDKGKLLMDDKGPVGRTNVEPDGPTDVAKCFVEYALDGSTVNTCRDAGEADAGFQDAPWSKAFCAKGIDRCMWTESTGYEHLMGVLKFQNEVTGKSEFDAPN